tara:strand:+ start:9873 stop:10337 length:465 start_codon:yes stop_codon:yes gene_type:complete
MDIVQYFSNNHDQLLYVIAGLSFVVELSVMGMGGPLLFFAAASFITGILVSMGVISGWEAEVFTVGVLTAAIAALLWKPFKRFQNSGGRSDTSSDMIGLTVPVSAEISHNGGSIRYSGINWKARLALASETAIAPDERCEIVAVEGNVMIVKAL